MSEKDLLYADGAGTAGRFVFDEKVVQVFPDMIARSVPGYDLVVPMTGMLARRYARPDSRLYDLGCSLGACTLAMRNAVNARPVRIVAVDTSSAMVERCRKTLIENPGDIPVDVIEADVADVPIENASVVVMNYTLQFIDPAHREELIRKIFAGLGEGGALILSEKIRFSDPSSQVRHTSWHEDFKRAKGYSELEIAGKRTALENVLKADTGQQHRDRLLSAGFRSVERWFQCFSFCSYLAIK